MLGFLRDQVTLLQGGRLVYLTKLVQKALQLDGCAVVSPGSHIDGLSDRICFTANIRLSTSAIAASQNESSLYEAGSVRVFWC